MNKTEIQAAMGEMEFSIVESGPLELPSSKPASFSFVEDSTYDPGGFRTEIEERGFEVFTPTTEQREDGEFYYYVDVLTDHYKRVKVRVWSEVVRIYPLDEAPDIYEFARIVQAVEAAFGELEHTPEADRNGE